MNSITEVTTSVRTKTASINSNTYNIMNGRSTDTFIAIAQVAKVVFETGYINAKFQPTITASELIKKANKYSIAWGRVNTDRLRGDIYRNIGIQLDDSGEIVIIKRGEFECTFNIHWTFELLVKFTRLAREEKTIKNSLIKQYTTFTWANEQEAKPKQAEKPKQDKKPFVAIAVSVKEPEKPRQANESPYNGRYVALLAERLNAIYNQYK